MPKTADYFQEVGEIAKELDILGLSPVLVGGMALIILGSQRVTQDFDFVITEPKDLLEKMLEVFYQRGFELITRLTPEGEVKSTIDNQKIASIRLRIDGPSSALFFNPETELRIDLLFDFPIPAIELTKNATKMKISSQIIPIASEKDLLRLKKIAKSARSSPRDAQDIDFLKKRGKKSIEKFIGSFKAPRNLAKLHDRYLYSSKKK